MPCAVSKGEKEYYDNIEKQKREVIHSSKKSEIVDYHYQMYQKLACHHVEIELELENLRKIVCIYRRIIEDNLDISCIENFPDIPKRNFMI